MHQSPQLLSEVSRRRVASLLREPRIAGDIEEAHCRRSLEAAGQSRGGQLPLECADDVACHGMYLVGAEDGTSRPVTQGVELLPELDSNRRDFGSILAGGPGLDDLGPKPVHLHLSDASHAVADGSQRALDG